VLVGYAAAMAFVLVYFAEHYVFDEVVGWAYAVVAFLVVGCILATRANRTVSRTDAGAAPDVAAHDAVAGEVRE